MSGAFVKANYITGFKAGADLSASTNRYCAVKQAADGDIELAGADEYDFIGILQNTPAENGACEIATMGGGSKAIAGGTINEADLLTTDASGHLVAITTSQTKPAVARALEAAVDNDIFNVLVLSGASHDEP